MGTSVPLDQGHRGQQKTVVGQPFKDSQVTDLKEEQQAQNPLNAPHNLLQDTFRTLQDTVYRFMHTNPICMGKVLHAIPHINWYKVQHGEGGTAIPCGMLSDSSFLPVGIRSTSVIPPNSNVLLWIPPGNNYGWILGVIPEEIAEGVVNISDWVQQGGNTGLKREEAHMRPFALHREGGTKDMSSRRPIDGTSMEWGRMAETGVGIIIDPFQAFIRVNEACGLFLNYWDSYCRLVALQMDIHTYTRQLNMREDEGENVYVDQNIIFPWEAVGCYAHGTDFTQEFPDKPVHYSLPKGKIDLPDGEEDIQTVARAVMYGGYLGQGWQRFLMAPKKDSGKRHYKDQDKDYGLFHDLVALDGSYTLRSAKSVSIGKRVLIPVPKRVKLCEDQEGGDDSRKGNYKFSSEFGSGGVQHKVKDVKVTGERKHMRRVAGVLDLLAYNYNWKGLHPFDYHENDYKMWEESELEPFNRATDVLDFSTLAGSPYMSDPSAKRLKVDKRYNDVDYFQRESYMNFLEDGGVVIGDGYGAQIEMSGGQIRITAPGDIQVLPGKRFVSFSWDAVIRAKNSVDISATEKDVRIKAEQNMQLVSNSKERGGILIQSKSENRTHIYRDKYGEDVVSSGIVLLAKQAETAMLSHEIYLRTGGESMRDGRITIDSSKGRKPTVFYAKTHHFFNSRGLNIWHAPIGETSNIVKSHRFSRNFSKIDGNLIVERSVCIAEGGLTAARNISSNRNIIAAGSLMHKTSPFVGFHFGLINFDADINKCKNSRKKHIQAGSAVFQAQIVTRWYTGNDRDVNQNFEPKLPLGNADLLEAIGFAFRDPPTSPGGQYKTTQYKLTETRWQQYSRTGMGTGGVPWTEKPVIYQNQETYPFPGKQKWTQEGTFEKYGTHTLFDEVSARSKDRRGPYEEPELSGWQPSVPNGDYKLIL